MRIAPKGRAAGYGCVVSALHKGTGPNAGGEAEIQTSQEERCSPVICPPREGIACNLYEGMVFTSSCPAQPL